jgi:hypothetical protein
MRRMNQLARLLGTRRTGRPAIEGPDIESDLEEDEEEEAHRFQEELEALLKEFEENEQGVNEQAEYISLERAIHSSITGAEQKFQDLPAGTLLP